MTTARQYDVAIIGFGPAGAVAAGLLGQAGLQVFVCDRLADIYDKPRAIALDHEILRVFQQLGVMADIEPYMEPFTPSEYLGVDGQLIKRFATVEPPYPLGYPPSLVFTQPPVEAVLRRRAATMSNVTVALRREFLNLTQDDTQVTLRLRDADGQESSVHARYAIGCDGASSTVRGLVGIKLEDLGFDEPWLVVDVLANEKGLAKLPKTSIQYCEPDRPCTYVIGPKNHRRWEISLKETEDPQQVTTPEGTWKLLERWMTPEDGELWRQASYRFHALVADSWRKGRVFIAGDAAHQQPPFLGQGMCQGVRDVANLCWKLEAAIKGRVQGVAAEDLLDSYGIERKQHVRQLTTRLKQIGTVICERDVAKARERDAQLLGECGGIVPSTPRQDVLPCLESGLIGPSGHGANGSIFPQPWVRLTPGGSHYRLDDLIGNGWQLIVAADAALPELPRISGWSLSVVRIAPSGTAAGDGTFSEIDDVVTAWFRRYGCVAALVRPDRYVYAIAERGEDVSGLVSDLVARMNYGYRPTSTVHLKLEEATPMH